MIPSIPTFPRPVIKEPSVFQIMDLIQGSVYTWYDLLKRVGVELLANEFDGLSLEQKVTLDKRMLTIRPEYRMQMQTMAQDIRPYRVWERHRESYEPHSALSQELVRMRSSTTISGDVFKRLRHPNPVFLLPGAPPITLPEGSPGRIIAIFITGAVAKRHQRPDDTSRIDDNAPGNASVLLDTHDPGGNAYHAMIVSEVHNPEGTEVNDMDWCHITIPVRNEFTLDGLARTTAEDGFNWTIPRETGEDKRYDYLLGVAQATVSHLLYACSRTVEVDDKPRATRPPAKRGKGAPKAPASARVRRMGWRVGAAIENGRRRAAEHRTTGTSTGRTMPPHMRGAHPHLYRVGPGRKEIEIKFLDPIPVNMGKDDGTTITSHPMR
jgi:hypothetical protein